MSILIKGMEMPDGDDAKIIAILSTGEVFSIYLDNESGELGFCRMSNNAVTAVFVPPHGRLIESEPLETSLEAFAYKNGGKSYAAYTVARTWVKNAPTIIPAEEAHNGE